MKVRLPLLAASIAVALSAGPSGACRLEPLGAGGFSVEHPGTIGVALALRSAIEQGLVEPLPEDNDTRLGTLLMMSWTARARVDAVAASGADGPPMSVLLTQSGVWIRLNDPLRGAVFHSGPPAPGEAVLLLPDTAYSALIGDAFTVDELVKLGLLRVYSEEPAASIEAFEQAVSQSRRSQTR